MKDFDELEGRLRALDVGPRARVREALLAAFDARRAEEHRRLRPRWVPSLATAALVLLGLGLAFAAGRWSVRTMDLPSASATPALVAEVEMGWQPAAADLVQARPLPRERS